MYPITSSATNTQHDRRITAAAVHMEIVDRFAAAGYCIDAPELIPAGGIRREGGWPHDMVLRDDAPTERAEVVGPNYPDPCALSFDEWTRIFC